MHLFVRFVVRDIIKTVQSKNLIAARFELAPVTTGALNQRLRPLGHATIHYVAVKNFK